MELSSDKAVKISAVLEIGGSNYSDLTLFPNKADILVSLPIGYMASRGQRVNGVVACSRL